MLVIGYLRSPYAPMVAAFRQDWRDRLCYGPETGPERSSTDARCRLWFAVSGTHPAGNGPGLAVAKPGRAGGADVTSGSRDLRVLVSQGELHIEDRHSVTDRRMTTEKCLVPCAPDSRQSNKFVEWPGPYSRRQFLANSAMAASRVAA